MIRRPNRTGDPARRRMGRGPVRSRPTRTGDGPKRPAPTATTRRRRPTRTGDGPKRTLPTGVRQIGGRRIGRPPTPEQRKRMLDAAMKMARKRAMDRAGKGRTNRSPDGKLGLLSGRMGSGRRRPTQRMTAQQRARLAAQRRAAQARSRNTRGRNLRRRISSGMGRRTLRRR